MLQVYEYSSNFSSEILISTKLNSGIMLKIIIKSIIHICDNNKKNYNKDFCFSLFHLRSRMSVRHLYSRLKIPTRVALLYYYTHSKYGLVFGSDITVVVNRIAWNFFEPTLAIKSPQNVGWWGWFYVRRRRRLWIGKFPSADYASLVLLHISPAGDEVRIHGAIIYSI